MPSEKLKTEDIISILGHKIITSGSHPEIGLSAGVTLEEYLSALEGQVLILDQKAAIDSTYTAPSAVNPIVLKDDLPTYIPDEDLGEFKDSVQTYAELPLVGNVTGDLRPVITDGIIYRWDGFNWLSFIVTGTLDHTQLYNQNNDINFQHLTSVEKTNLLSSMHNHTNALILDAIENSGSGIIISSAERSRLPTQDEIEAMNEVLVISDAAVAVDPGLDTITYNGHGLLADQAIQFYSSNGTLPSPIFGPPVTYYVIYVDANTFKVATIPGGSAVDLSTSGTGQLKIIIINVLTPSGSNRFVTNFDPRLNTIRNPYITFGQLNLPPPAPSFWGTDIRDFIGQDLPLPYKEGALRAITARGTAHIVRTIEILPGTTVSPLPPDPYIFNTINYDPIVRLPTLDIQFPASAVDSVTNTISIAGGGLSISGDGLKVQFMTTGSLPSGILAGESYGLLNSTASNFQLTKGFLDLSYSRVPILLGSTGSGIHTMIPCDALLLQSLALRAANFRMGPLVPTIYGGYALQLLTSPSPSSPLGIDPGPVIMRGLTLELKEIGTRGIVIERTGTTLEECSIVTVAGEPAGRSHEGIKILANDVTLRRCIIKGEFDLGAVNILGDNVLLENCFLATSNASTPLLTISGNNTTVSYSTLNSGVVTVGSGVQNTQLNKNIWLTTASLVDNGLNTRFLSWQGTIQGNSQPWVGKTKTIGPTGSFADFTGNDQTPFVSALVDRYTDEIIVLPGTYTFTSELAIPSGKTVRGVLKTQTSITKTGSGFSPIKLSGTDIVLSDLSFSASIDPVVLVDPLSKNISISRCTFNTTTDLALNFGLTVSSDVDRLEIKDCAFTGIRGLSLSNGDIHFLVKGCIFQTSKFPFISATTCSNGTLVDNSFIGTDPTIIGNGLLILGNIFNCTVPSKIGTSNSLWCGNWPAEANNTEGIDQLKINLEGVLSPTPSSGAARDLFLGIRTLAYLETGEGEAVTSPVCLLPVKVIDETQGFSLTWKWTSSVFSGTTVWEASVVFRDQINGIWGGTTKQLVTSTRTGVSARKEDTATVSFGIGDYGGVSVPTHVGVSLKRLTSHPSDNFPGTAHVTELVLSLPRD